MKKLILFLLFISLPAISYAGVSSGTFTVRENGTGNYTSIVTAEAGLQGVLISTCFIVMDSSWTNTDDPVTFAGWTTFSSAPVYVMTSGAGRHSGIWDNTCYRIVLNAEYDLFDLGSCKVIYIDGVQIQNTLNTGAIGGQCIKDNNTTAGKERYILNCILKGKDYTAPIYGFDFQGTGRFGIYFWNNILYNLTVGLNCPLSIANSTWTVYNNTISSCSTGILLGSASRAVLYMKNNLCQTSMTADYDLTGWITSSTTLTNVSQDATSPDIAYRNQIASFTSYSGQNFHLLRADTTAYAKGTNLSADTILPVTTDIDNETRPANSSIGADDIVTAVTIRRRSEVSTIID